MAQKPHPLSTKTLNFMMTLTKKTYLMGFGHVIVLCRYFIDLFIVCVNYSFNLLLLSASPSSSATTPETYSKQHVPSLQPASPFPQHQQSDIYL